MNPQLKTFPDLDNWNELKDWVLKIEREVIALTPNDLVGGKPLTRVSYTPETNDTVLGTYASEQWRKFALSVFVADWVCYTKPEDKADFPRTLSVVATFPQGFDVYFAETKDGRHLPVGYTGWYPIMKDVYNMMENTPEKLTHRGMMMPLRELSELEDNFIYLFNYSIAEQFIDTKLSMQMMKNYSKTLSETNHIAKSCVTVSPHGIRVAKKFGMHHTGDMTHMGDTEGVFCGLRL